MRKLAIVLSAVMVVIGLTTASWAGEATREEVVEKCQKAAQMIQAEGIEAAIKAIGDKKGPFVWKDTYVFLMDMDAKMLAHPIKPELTQRDTLLQVKDTAGKPLFAEFVEIANKKGSGWVDYLWPKPGQDAPVNKSSYIYRVTGTQYVVGAGIYTK